MAKRDEDGFYYITGRKKRFLKIFGNRVNLDEVETLLKKEGIESVCVGKDDMMKIFITNPEKRRKRLITLCIIRESAGVDFLSLI